MFVSRSQQRKIRARLRQRRNTGTFRKLVGERLEDRRLLTGVDSGDDSFGGGITVDKTDYASDSLIIRFRDDATPSQLSMGPNIAPLPFSANVTDPYEILPSLREVELPEYVSVESALEMLEGHESILYAEPNYRIHATATPNDPRFSDLWGLSNEEQTGGTYDADIDAPEAWDQTVGSGNTIVAVIDTGVDYTHEDLAANMWVNTGETPGDGIDNDGNGFVDDIHGWDFVSNDASPMDDQGHGTHVAGTIAAVGNNSIGVTGINWNAKIMALKFLNAQGSGDTDDAIKALDYAVAHGATISNNSWGYEGNFSQSLYDAVAAARAADHVFVTAAGNGLFGFWGVDIETNPWWPASIDLDNVVSVAAVDHNDTKPFFSNWGAVSVDLAAPGVDIISTTPNDGYGLNTGTSMASPHVAGVIALVRDQHPDWTYSEVIYQVMQAVDPIPAMDGITVTGGRLNAARAVGVQIVPSPEIQVLLDGENLVDGSSTVDYGSTPPGLAQDLTFTVKNRGVRPLNLPGPISVPDGYTVVESFGSSVVEVGETTTFTIRLDGQVEGSYSGNVSFTNDDQDEDPFDFTVTGTVAIPPSVEILDNGDSGFATTGDWNQWSGQGYQNDIHESFGGSGLDVASWTFDRLLPGKYRVAATWAEYTNRATNSPFTIFDEATALGTVVVNQQLNPEGFREGGADWQYLGGAVTVTGSELKVELSDDADGRVNADAIRIERLEPVPEIDVTLDGVVLADGTATVDLGITTTMIPIQRTFTVTNLGASDLVLNPSISLPAGYSLLSGFNKTTLTTDDTTTFSVQLDAASAGTYAGVVSFSSNDADESPFDFTIQGEVQDPAPVQIVDNGDAAFAEVGDWTQWSGQGYLNDIHESAAGTGDDVVTWSFSGLIPGTYRVAATWTSYTNRASDAPFTILDGQTPIATVLVDQLSSPAGFTEDGATWQYLGTAFQITGQTLNVTLSDDANGRVNADAIRIERIGDDPEIDVRLDGAAVQDGVSNVDLGSTPTGNSVDRTFTVQNLGGSDLVLDPSISLPDGFSLEAGFSATTLSTDQSATFTVRLDSATAGTYSGTISFNNNDSDESPFNFTIEGVVEDPPAIQIIDNGDTLFSTVGQWTHWSGQGYGNDIHESYAGSGADVASWEFTGLVAGYYRAAATWTSHSNRATNATYDVVVDGVTEVSEAVNQQIAPGDFNEAGANWAWLGAPVQIDGGSIVVQLDDAADGRLNADAVRLERLPLAPEIEVSAGTTNLVDGSSTFDFGSTPPGVPITQVFTVANVGTETLTLQEPITVTGGFSLDSSFGVTSLAPGEDTSFTVRFDGAGTGVVTGTASFASSDADESPFDFNLSGTVAIPPAVQTIDNGGAGYASVGSWTTWTGQGFENDIDEAVPGSGTGTANWTFAGLVPGSYRVAATWTNFTNRASNAPFTILDDANTLTTVYVNQKLAPSGFSDNGATWQYLGTVHEIESNTLAVRLSDMADGRLNADAIRIERLDPEPEIQVAQNGVDIADGSGYVNFGATSLGTSIELTFTVTNQGGEDLHLNEPISVPDGFSVKTGFGQTVLATDQSTTFVLKLDSTTVGTFSGPVSFQNDDADESPFDFNVQGTVLAPPPVVILDNGDAGFESVGEWRRYTGQGYSGDIHESVAGTGADEVTWTFTNLVPGNYRVSATWTAFSNRASNSPFTILDGESILSSLSVDQRVAPSGFSDAGVMWHDLAESISINDGILVVRLSDEANGRVNADAIRIERLAE